MWRFMALADSVFDRRDDSGGEVGDAFRAAGADPRKLADRTFGALTRNDYGQYDGLVAVLAPALGNEGLERLKRRAVVPGPGGLKGGAGLPERPSRFAWTPNAPVRAPRCCCRLTAMDRMTPVPGRDRRRRRPGAGP